MLELLAEPLHDIIKTLPILFVAYALLHYIENRLDGASHILARTEKFGPIVGAVAGTIPQCGFSAAAAALFSAGCLAPSALVSVFLATSDEAIPVLLASGISMKTILFLILIKFILAVLGGYTLRFTIFRNFKTAPTTTSTNPNAKCCHDAHDSWISSILWRTFKTALLLFAIMLAIDLIIEWIGTDLLSSILLTDSVFQPLLCAVLGLIPSCAVSVLLSELFVSGTISFGSLIAGLSTGAGFGYIVLFGDKKGRKKALPVVFATFVFAVLGGTLLHVFG